MSAIVPRGRNLDAPEGQRVNDATCIGCGCEDERACDGGCAWLRVDRVMQLGVCSQCPEHVTRWDAGDFSLSSVARDDYADEGTLILPGDEDFDETLEWL